MNDPGLEDTIEDTENRVEDDLQRAKKRVGDDKRKLGQWRNKEKSGNLKSSPMRGRRRSQSRGEISGATSDASDGHESDSDEEEDESVYQPTLWWFTSTAFPLFAGSFGPIANLFSVCALVQPWRIDVTDGRHIPDPSWLIAMNACSLGLALFANVTLLFNFARRVRYSLAQPITISLWYISCILLVIPIVLVHRPNAENKGTVALSQAYYYGLISTVLYFSLSTLLLLSTLGATLFHKYPPSFSTLTGPQRTLMLQTTAFSLYLALGAGIFSSIEGWAFVDGVYWADYTLLTIGLGSDFPLGTTLGRMLLIPYAAIGITMIGLVVSSVRALVLERAKAKMVRRHLGKEREKWQEDMDARVRRAKEGRTRDLGGSRFLQLQGLRLRRNEKRLKEQVQQNEAPPLGKEDRKGAWHRAEFELMRFIQDSAESTEQYTALGSSFLVMLVVWIGGSLIFWSCEEKGQQWTYPDSLYFSYTTLLTIGYGDFYPASSAGKPFFVVWSLISVPAMTVLISNMGDTVIKWIRDATVWASKWTILPEKQHGKRPAKGKRQSGDEEKSDQRKNDNNNDNSDILEHDVEKLGGAVEEFEEEEGRSGSLAAEIAREVARLAKDLNVKPPKKYSWERWERWLHMLGEREKDGSRVQKTEEEGESPPSAPPITDNMDNAVQADRFSVTDDWRWTWLGDGGPLFSRLTETEWVMEKLCFRLEEVLEDEIREARGEL